MVASIGDSGVVIGTGRYAAQALTIITTSLADSEFGSHAKHVRRASIVYGPALTFSSYIQSEGRGFFSPLVFQNWLTASMTMRALQLVDHSSIIKSTALAVSCFLKPCFQERMGTALRVKFQS